MYDRNSGNVKLVDFGMAQKVKGKLKDDTYAVSLLSTPKYVPPEMATEFKSYKTSDVFQLGVLFHELLTGYHPFAACNFEEGDSYRESEIVKYALANLCNERDKEYDVLKQNPEIDSLVESMLDKDYKKRPKPSVVRDKLDEIIENYG